jgi:hypothetical protein
VEKLSRGSLKKYCIRKHERVKTGSVLSKIKREGKSNEAKTIAG